MNCPCTFVGELAREQKLGAHAGPHALVVEDRVHAAAAGDFLAGKRRIPMLLGRRAVAHEALPPRIEHVAPGVAVAGRHEVRQLHRPRIEHVRPGRIVPTVRAPRRFHRGAHRHAFEHVE